MRGPWGRGAGRTDTHKRPRGAGSRCAGEGGDMWKEGRAWTQRRILLPGGLADSALLRVRHLEDSSVPSDFGGRRALVTLAKAVLVE